MFSLLLKEFIFEFYAHILAYGMKGSSLLTETYRKMVLYVLSQCKAKSLYVPLVTSDSAFQRVAVRSTSNAPLTLLQLQKDVWTEAKKTQKSSIISHFKNHNKFNGVCVKDSAGSIGLLHENRSPSHTATLSENTRSMVVQHFKSGIEVLDQEDDIDEQINEPCNASSFLSDEMLEKVDDDALEAAEKILQDNAYNDIRIQDLELSEAKLQNMEFLNEEQSLSDISTMFENEHDVEENQGTSTRVLYETEVTEMLGTQSESHYKLFKYNFKLMLLHLKTDTRCDNQKWKEVSNITFVHMFDTQDSIESRPACLC